MTYQMMEKILDVATNKAEILLKHPNVKGGETFILESIALKQYIYEKETEGETD